MIGGDECICNILVALSGYKMVFESLQNGNHYGYNSVSYIKLINISRGILISVSILATTLGEFGNY